MYILIAMSDQSAKVSPLRSAHAALTRRHIVSAARGLFVASGYVTTSISAIAREAGVSVQTIYNSVGNKAAVLSAVLDMEASGRKDRLSVPELMTARVDGTTTPSEVVNVLSDWFLEVNARTADIWTVIHQAAAVDESAARVQKERDEQRLRNYLLAAAALRERGALEKTTDEEAAAMIWTIGHPESYRVLVNGLSWTAHSYRELIRKTLLGALGAQ